MRPGESSWRKIPSESSWQKLGKSSWRKFLAKAPGESSWQKLLVKVLGVGVGVGVSCGANTSLHTEYTLYLGCNGSSRSNHRPLRQYHKATISLNRFLSDYRQSA